MSDSRDCMQAPYRTFTRATAAGVLAVALAAAVWAAPGAGAQDAEAAQPRLDLAEGDELTVTVVRDRRVRALRGDKLDDRITERRELDLKVARQEQDGRLVVVGVYARTAASFRSRDDTFTVDTGAGSFEKTKLWVDAAPWVAATNARLSFTLTPDGRVRGAYGHDGMEEAILARKAQVEKYWAEGGGRPRYEGGFAKGGRKVEDRALPHPFTDEALGEMLRHVFEMRPDQPLREGGTWSRRQEVAPPDGLTKEGIAARSDLSPLLYEQRLTCTDIEDGRDASMEFDMEIAWPAMEKDDGRLNPRQRLAEADGEGSAEYDLTDGLLVEWTSAARAVVVEETTDEDGEVRVRVLELTDAWEIRTEAD